MRRIARLGPLALLLLCPLSASAQAGVTILGTVSDADSDVGIEAAILTLEGLGSTMTTPDGSFRFRGVQPGDYVLRVEAFGYEPLSVPFDLASDTTLALVLEAAPFPIDSIIVEATHIDFEGRVRDRERDFLVVDAEIATDGREPIWTDAHGRFDLDDVPDGAPLHLTVRAFGYLPIDTTFVPDDEERYDFDLARDAFAEAMIQMQVRRLEERAGGKLMNRWGSMDRSDILAYTGAHTAGSMLQFELPRAVLRRVVCVFLDDRLMNGRSLSISHVLPEEIERVELLDFPELSMRSPPVMVRIYTRSYIMAMSVQQDIPLREPTMGPTGCLS